MRKPTVHQSPKKNTALTRRRGGLMALEPRFMFDGAAVAESVQATVDAAIASDAKALVPAALAQAEQMAQQKVAEFVSKASDQELFTLFNGGRQAPDAAWAERLSQIRDLLNQGELPVNWMTMEQASQFTAVAAFAQHGPDGKPTIFVNPYWMGLLDNQDVANVLVEELGHWMDSVLNPDADTPQDEGERFAQAVLEQSEGPSNVAQDDSGWVVVNGERYAAEFASFNFVNAYEMVYDQDNDTFGKTTAQITTGDVDVSERWADKEQNLHYFNANVSLGVVSISDGNTNNANFSGNDVSAIAVTVGGNNIYGWISRPIKANGVVRGFYFWTDADRFGTLADAQADNNMDGDSSSLNNRGFVFVVDQTWFNAQIASTGATKTINNTKDGNDGTITVASVGSSSDRVDSALNSVLTPNSAPTAANDTLTVAEDSGTTSVVVGSGLLSNDTDANSDTLTITGYTIAGVSGTQAVGSTVTITGVGDVRINADGSYTFAPVSGYTGAVPPITYTVSDGKGGAATAVLSITVTPVNDPPVAVADTGTVTEDTPLSGLLMSNDSDPDGNPITVQSFSVTGLSGPFTLGTAYTIPNVGTITVNANGSYTFVPAANFTGTVPVINYTITDGQGGTASSTLTLTMSPANDPPVANPDNANNAAFAVEAGCHVTGNDQNGTALTNSGSDQTGNVLDNDTDPDTGATRTVTAVTSENGNTWSNGTVTGRYGTLTISSTGAYTYDIAETNATVNALNVGDVLNEYFTYTATDNAGATASSTLKIVIKGSNDVPVALNDYDSVVELSSATSYSLDGTNTNTYGTATGTVRTNDSDVDSNALSVTNIAAPSVVTYDINFGGNANSIKNKANLVTKVEASTNGTTWTTLLNADGTNVTVKQWTGSGNTLSAVLSSSTALSSYATGSTTVRVTLSDGNTYSGAYNNSTTSSASSDTVASGAGNEGWVTGSYGKLKIAADGSYTYYLTNTSLAAGDTAQEQFTYTLTDGTCSTTATLNITVNGTTGLVMDDETVTTNEDTAYTSSSSVNSGNNLLTGDSYNSNTLTSVTGFSWGGTTGTLGTAMTKTGIGTLTIESTGYYTFTPASNYSGPVPTVLYTASNGTESGQATLTISITPVDDASVMTADTKTIPEDGSGTGNVLANDSDVDNTLSVASYTWNNGSSTVSGSVGSATSITSGGGTVGSLTLNADGSYTFTPAADWNGTVPVITYTTNTGSTSTLTITVTPVNDGPTLDLDANNGSGATGSNFATNYTNGTAGVSIGDADTQVADIDDVNMESATVVLLNPQSGDLLNVGSLPAGINYTTSTAGGVVTITLSGSATLANYQTAIKAITFSSTGHSTDDRIVSVKVNDGDVDSNTAYTTITVAPDARLVTVLGTVVNEASPYVMFEVAGAEGQWVSLALGTTGTGTGYAINGTDFLPNLEYFNGSAWVGYTGGLVQIPDTSANNGKLLVRTAVLQDAVFETTASGYESLKLTAYNAAGTANAVTGAVDTLAEGMAQIRDDGQGSIFLGNNNGSGNALSPNSPTDTDPNGPDYPAYLDDDRPVEVNSIGVNEGSPKAVFTVTGSVNQIVRFTLTNGTATIENGSAPVASDGSEDYGPGLEIWNGTTWQSYTFGQDFTLTGTTTYVRTTIVNDTLYEGQHSFVLGVTRQSAGDSVYGTGSIYDDGTGSYWIGDATAPASNNDLTTNSIVLDDDRSISVLAYGPVNEGSQYAMFKVTATPDQELDLVLQAATSGTGATYGPFTSQYSTDGSTWTTYSANSKPMVPANGVVYVRVNITSEADSGFEGEETFALKASFTSNTSNNAADDTSIVDDGTGAKYGPNVDPSTGPAIDLTGLDDDRDPTVNSIAINEASDWAVFTVSSTSGCAISGFDIQAGTSNVARVDGASIQYWDGTAWSNTTTTGMTLNVAAGGSLLVRVNIRSEQDVPYEDAETFQLKVISTGGLGTMFGTGTIMDDGTGNKYVFDNDTDPTNDTQNPTTTTGPGNGFDDDRPQMLIGNVSVEEGSTAVFNVTVGEAIAPYTVTFATSLAGQSASSSDIGNTLIVKAGSTVISPNNDGSYTVPAGTTALTVSVETNDDNVYEGLETFLLTGKTEFMTANTNGTGTIADDGSANDGDDSNSIADDDRPVLTVAGVDDVSEGSYSVFTVTLDKALAANTNIKLLLGNGTAQLASDLDSTTMEVVTSLSTAIGSGTSVSDGGNYTLAAGTQTFYVRVLTKGDNPAVYEGAENFNLTASFVPAALLYADRTGTNTTVRTGGSANDTSTILDDGSGRVYDGRGGNTGTPDDDRTISVTSFGPVNEASQYAMFMVTAAPNQVLDLDLQAATSGTAATRTGFTYEYSLDGTTWTTYSSTSKPTVPAGGKVYVRVDISSEADAPYEGAETFALKASFTSNTSKNAAADTTIVDDGTGTKYGPNVDPSTGPATNTTNLDDDRAIAVTAYGPVNEASPYAMFTVTSTPGQQVDLDLQAATTGTAATRTGFTYEYSLDGTTWTTYSSTSKPTVPAGGKVYVRVDISSESDTDYEVAETFALKASFTSNPANSAAADTTIVDDGTGTKYGPNVNPSTGPATNTNDLDDDRPKLAPPPPVLPPVTPPAPRPADPLPPPPVVSPPQAFASTLQPLAPKPATAEPPLSLGDAVTSGSGYQIPVSETAPQGLTINRGVTDQFIQSTDATSKISLPFDAFIHSNKDAVIKLQAKQADDAPLPKWVQFDPTTGVFEVTPPKGFKGKLDLKVIARDDDGREATAIFQMFIGEQNTDSKPQSRTSFTEKLRMAGNRPITLVRVAEAGPHKALPAEARAVKARAG